jgi:hypothetical protein
MLLYVFRIYPHKIVRTLLWIFASFAALHNFNELVIPKKVCKSNTFFYSKPFLSFIFNPAEFIALIGVKPSAVINHS